MPYVMWEGFGHSESYRLLVQPALALIVILAISWLWSRVSLNGIFAGRKISSDRAQVGQSLRETLTIRNNSRIGKLWVELLDQSTLPGHDPGRVVHVPRRSTVEWEARTLCVRRGRFHLGPISLASGDPLGVFRTHLATADAQEIIVYPAVVDLREAGIPEGALSGGSALERRTPHVTSNVAGIRDYVTGDAFNRIAWSATARLGR